MGKAELIEKASKLYLDYGIKGVTMDDVARSLGISKKTLYELIKDKRHLVDAVVRAIQGKEMDLIKQIQAKELNAIEHLFEINRLLKTEGFLQSPVFINDLKKYYPKLVAKEKREQGFYRLQILKENLAKGKQEGLYRSDINEDLVARIWVSVRTLFAFDPLGLFTDIEVGSESFVCQMMSYHLHAICSEQGRSFLARIIKQKEEKNTYAKL